MKFKTAIFDLDGTLLNTIEDLADSMNAVLSTHGFPTHDVEAYKYFVGEGVVKLVERALPANAPSKIELYLKEMHNEYNSRWDNKTRPYEGVNEMLSILTDMKLPLNILSNKPHDFTELTVSKLLSEFKFENVCGVNETRPPKPNPQGAIDIANLVGVAPEEVLYLGDTGTDMKTANSAGMYAVGASWGFRPVEEMKENGAREIIDNPMELIRIAQGG